jgi:hypothetical protein
MMMDIALHILLLVMQWWYGHTPSWHCQQTVFKADASVAASSHGIEVSDSSFLGVSWSLHWSHSPENVCK